MFSVRVNFGSSVLFLSIYSSVLNLSKIGNSIRFIYSKIASYSSALIYQHLTCY